MDGWLSHRHFAANDSTARHKTDYSPMSYAEWMLQQLGIPVSKEKSLALDVTEWNQKNHPRVQPRDHDPMATNPQPTPQPSIPRP